MTFEISDGELVDDGSEYYGSVEDGSNYFSRRLNSSPWDDASDTDKLKSLWEATRLIDCLNFKGSKADSSQILQFPRGEDEVIPADIRYATYEIAYRLLDGIDPDLEQDDLRTSAQGYSSVRVSKDTAWGQEYLQNGIPSARAWHLLRPYLRDPLTIKINRTN